jgi:hypothetical protein
MANFEVFDRRSRPVGKQPTLTIQKRGNFSLNRAAFDALGQPAAVELLFDRVQRIVGFRPTDEHNRRAYPVRKQQNAASYLIAGNAFNQYYGIETGITRRYDAAMIDGILVVDLKQPGQEVISTRRQKSSEHE